MKSKRAMAAAAMAFAAFAAGAAVTQFSKLGIITAAKSAGKWDALKTWIAASGYEDEWQACSYLSDGYPQFAAITNAVVAADVATADELAAILAASKDTAVPDDMIRRVVENDCKTSSGRVRWHGALVAQIIDTNACEKVEVYADGTRFKFPFTPPRAVAPAAAKLNSAGIPARLAAARERRARELATTNTVNIVVGPGAKAAEYESAAEMPEPESEQEAAE